MDSTSQNERCTWVGPYLSTGRGSMVIRAYGIYLITRFRIILSSGNSQWSKSKNKDHDYELIRRRGF
jgi:hypothetical protein